MMYRAGWTHTYRDLPILVYPVLILRVPGSFISSKPSLAT